MARYFEILRLILKILLASNNAHKLAELKELLKSFEIYAFDEVLNPFDIAETGSSFKENALIKAKAVFNALDKDKKKEFIVLSDDSGLCVEALNGAPGIYSARFSEQKNDAANNAKLIAELQSLNLKQSKAHYTACIAAISRFGALCAHGYLHGQVIDVLRGQNGFGYDSLFIPKGFTETLGELEPEIKAAISHRAQALKYMKILLEIQKKG